MTREEVQAIERAILAGIEATLERVFVRPFPENDLKAAIFHARGHVRDAVERELSRIRTTR